MIAIATIWAIITIVGMLYGVIEPRVEQRKDLKRFKEYK
jgi:hypothetical protein